MGGKPRVTRPVFLDELMALAPAVEGAVFAIDGDRLAIRREDGVVAQVAIRTVGEVVYPAPRGPVRGAPVAVVRCDLPVPPEPARLSALNAAASLVVASGRRGYRISHTILRGQLLAQEPARFLKALARDLQLRESIPAPAPISLADVRGRLDAVPVVSPERRLLDAILGDPPTTHAGSHYALRGDHLAGPSSVASFGGTPPVPVEIRVTELGLVAVRHVHAARPGGDPHAVAADIAELASDDESCVTYVRAHVTAEGTVALEITATLAEIDTVLFQRRMRALEIDAASYLHPEPPRDDRPLDKLFDLF